MAIQIIKQNDGINTDQPKYRVEIKDNGGYGLGYGDTPREAYAEARTDYEEYRAADTERFLDESLSQFEREERKQAKSVLPLFDFGEEAQHLAWKSAQS